MFATVKQILNPKNKDIQKRILYTLFVLFIFRLGVAIVIPGIDKDSLGLAGLDILELLNVMGGGALERFSIFSLGVSPYISASIVMQILEKLVPQISEIGKEGYTGRAKLNKMTRMLGIALAFVQGFIYSITFIGSSNVADCMLYSIILTAGTAFLLWLGDQITSKGIGNGISIIIMAGILANLPTMFITAYNALIVTDTVQTTFIGSLSFALFVLIYIGIVIGVIYSQTAERRIPIQYANKSTSTLSKQSYIPFKLNSSGVMPVILVSVFFSIIGLIMTAFKNDSVTLFYNTWVNYTTPTGLVLYVVMIFVFSYVYTYIQIDTKEMAENLEKSGGYIPGVRPGVETSNYIKTVINRITVVGTISLSIIAILPLLMGMFSNLPASVSIGGTGLLIVVGVALEVYKQIESTLVSRNYKVGKRK